jgi:hypothetical protein
MRASTARIEAVIGGCGLNHLLPSENWEKFLMRVRIDK